MSGRPQSHGDRALQLLLLAPGVALLTTGLLNLFPDPTAVAWALVVVGLALLLAFTRAAVRRHARHQVTSPRAGTWPR